MRVVLEPKMEAHDAELYRADALAESIQGFESVNEEAISFYRENGYLLVRNGLPSEITDAARQRLMELVYSDDPQCEAVYFEGAIRDRMLELEDGNKGSDKPERDDLALGNTTDQLPNLDPKERSRFVRKFMGFVENHPPVNDIAAYPPMMETIEKLSGSSMKLFQDMAMIKPPGGREKPWHQDHAYFNLPVETRIVAAWVALDDVSIENGCMFMLTGGHVEGPRIHFMRRDWQLCDSDTRRDVQTAAPMKCGDVLLFDAKLPHGTPTNKSDRHRWALQLHYIPTVVSETSDQERLALFGSEGKNVSC